MGKDSSPKIEEFGLGEEDALVAGAISETSAFQENIIAFHAYMQNIPAEVSKAAKGLRDEMYNGFPATKEYFGEMCKNMKEALNPKTIAENAAKACNNIKQSFSNFCEYAKKDMKKDLFAKVGAFVKAVKENFLDFVKVVQEKMTPAFEQANKTFGEIYTKIAEKTKPARDAVGETMVYKKAKEAGVAGAKMVKEAATMVGDKANEAYNRAAAAASKKSGMKKE